MACAEQHTTCIRATSVWLQQRFVPACGCAVPRSGAGARGNCCSSTARPLLRLREAAVCGRSCAGAAACCRCAAGSGCGDGFGDGGASARDRGVLPAARTPPAAPCRPAWPLPPYMPPATLHALCHPTRPRPPYMPPAACMPPAALYAPCRPTCPPPCEAEAHCTEPGQCLLTALRPGAMSARLRWSQRGNTTDRAGGGSGAELEGGGGAGAQGAAPTRIDRDGAARTFSTYTSFGYFSRCVITWWPWSHRLHLPPALPLF